MELSAIDLKIPFKTSFKHARAERKQTQSIFVTLKRNNHTGLGEACPREYVTGESVNSCLKWIKDNKNDILQKCTNLDKLKEWVTENREKINQHPSAWCAVELALLDLFAKEKKVSIEQLLSLPPLQKKYNYTAVIGEADEYSFAKILAQYKNFEFNDFKLKVSGDIKTDNRKIEQIIKSGDQVRIRLDANNLWGKNIEKAEKYLAGLKYQVAAIEEPVTVGDFVTLNKLSNEFSLPIIFDESVCTIHDLEQIPLPPAFSIINVRISKMGGLLRTLEMIDRIREKKFSIIIGCLVGETSLLSRVALTAASYCGDSLIAQEGAFGDLLLQHDFVEPMIRFGKKGILEFGQEEYPPQNPEAGWGLKMIEHEY